MPIKVTLPRLHRGQLKIKTERKRHNVIDCGRRFGKNILLQDLAIEGALAGKSPVGWGAPVYKQTMDDYRSIDNLLGTAVTRRSISEMRLDLISGGSIEFWSLDKPDSIRGKKYSRFIVNEAGFVPSLLDIRNFIITPTLIDMQGDEYYAGTPKGMNGFFSLYSMSGEGWKNWQMSSYENPHIPRSELDGLKLTMTERSFQQEIMAQFLEDGAGIFRNVRAAATSIPLEAGEPGHQYIIGADWARTEDATVFKVFDMTERREVASDRMLNTDFASQRLRLKALVEHFNNALVIAEQNSIGQPQIEELQNMGVSVQGFLTTNATKAQIIQALELAFERKEIQILDDEQTINELMAFTGERLPSGMMRYAAPEGMHDDTVIAEALAWHGIVGANLWTSY